MSTAQRVLGGLLVGTGQGMVDTAVAKRNAALEMVRNQNLADREAARDRRTAERQAASDKRRGGLLSNIATDASGNLIGVTASGDTKPLNIRSGKKADQPDSGLSVEDKREIDLAIKRHTTGKDSLQGEQTDWSAVAETLRKGGREDLARRVAPPASEAAGVDVESPEYREAKQQAEAWASDQAGVFRTDKTDFAQYGGNRAEAIQAKTLELYQQMKGAVNRSGGASVSSGASQPQSPTGGAAPAGSGTQADPYRAATQADIEWVKNNAPAGSVIEIQGQLYQK